MTNHLFKALFFFISLLSIGLTGCDKKKTNYHKQNLHGEHIYRNSSDFIFIPPAPFLVKRPLYPWEKFYIGGHPRITKDFFRCKGNLTHLPIEKVKSDKPIPPLRDCPGGERHGLPVRDGKEFVYPCLIELLNYLQDETGQKVLITSGHRCPQHNSYCDDSSSNRASKHLIGAEVDFYVEGFEHQPEKIIELVQKFYQNSPLFKGKSEFSSFQRYQKEGLNVSTPPWYNKEIFIKLYKTHEGRNIDNDHPYPYIGLQVRYDRDSQTQVIYDPKAAQNYLRP